MRPNENIYHIFQAKNFKDVQHPYQDKASMDMTINGFKIKISPVGAKDINLSWPETNTQDDID